MGCGGCSVVSSSSGGCSHKSPISSGIERPFRTLDVYDKDFDKKHITLDVNGDIDVIITVRDRRRERLHPDEGYRM